MPLLSTFGTLSARGFGMTSARAASAFTPLSLFASGEQGAWYDPSDLTTMFQDSAGTTPVGTPGNGSAQPVGKILDKSGRGNHATQSTGSARPELSAKYNLLTYSEAFNNAVWNTYNVTKTTSTLTLTSTVGSAYQTPSGINAGTYRFACKLQAGTNNFACISLQQASGGYASSVFDLANGVTGETKVTGSGWSIASSAITSLGSGVYLCEMVATTGASVSAVVVGFAAKATANTWDSYGNVTGCTSGNTLNATGADLRVSNDGVGLPAYQRVVDANTYDSTGFPYYLLFNGVDQKMSAAGVDLSGTNKLSAFMAARKLGSSTDSDMLCGPWHDSAGKTFQIYYSGSASKFGFGSWGTSYAQVTNPTSEAPPIGKVITGLSDISSYIKLRLNGTQVASGGGQGTGNYRSQTIYLSSDTAYNANMRMFGAILRGASTTDADVTSTENWLNGKAKIY